MADGFLGRWAKRKEAVRKGEPLPPEPVVEVAPAVQPAPPPQPSPGTGGNEVELAAPPPPPPTLVDVESLTPASDFSRYVLPDVAPDVKNAAMKKLFADPHFNIMDRLDTYIDDYGKPDPIPPEMLRQLASSKFLRLFEEEEKQEQAEKDAKAPTGREVADDPAHQTVAQSGTAEAIPPAVPPAEDHADPDLRLQQDDAPGPEGPGPRA